jgi:hypothetical protein
MGFGAQALVLLYTEPDPAAAFFAPAALPADHALLSQSTLAAQGATHLAELVAQVGEGWARGDRNWSLSDGQRPDLRVVRVPLGTGYNRVEGNRRALRNGRVSSSPTRIATLSFCRCNCRVLWSYPGPW